MHTRARGRVAVVLALACGALFAGSACAAADAPSRVGMSAPDVTATTLGGDSVSLASFRGEPLLVNLWATWCVPCRDETPYLQTLHEDHAGRGLRVIGVSVDARGLAPEVDAFLEEFGVTYTILRDPAMTSVDRFGVPGLPATFLIDRDFTVRRAVVGPLTPGDSGFEGALRSLLE